MYVNTLIVGTLALFAGVYNVHAIPSDYLSLWNQPEKIEKHNDIKAAIIGGQEMKDGELPYQVAIVTAVTYQQFCGGSVLNSKWILTAAHCVVENGRALHESQIVVFAGSANLKKNGHRLNVRKIVVHPKYYKNINFSPSDIALLKLTSTLPIDGRLIAAVTLPRRSYPAGTACTVSGWGTSQYTRSPTQLRSLKTQTTDFKKCLAEYTDLFVDSTNFCSYNTKGTGACDGDSGGPLVIFESNKTVQIGVASAVSGEGCAVRRLDIYVDVSKFLDFINSNIKNM